MSRKVQKYREQIAVEALPCTTPRLLSNRAFFILIFLFPSVLVHKNKKRKAGKKKNHKKCKFQRYKLRRFVAVRCLNFLGAI